jgi:hypothetical protein
MLVNEVNAHQITPMVLHNAKIRARSICAA